MTVQPQYDASGVFMGFSACIGGEWTTPQPYKALMLAIGDSGSDPIYIPEVIRPVLPNPYGLSRPNWDDAR